MTRELSESGDTPPCPECGNEGYPNPVLDDEYQCSRCVIAYNAAGEVTARE